VERKRKGGTIREESRTGRGRAVIREEIRLVRAGLSDKRKVRKAQIKRGSDGGEESEAVRESEPVQMNVWRGRQGPMI
jgi:hypothetical protein